MGIKELAELDWPELTVEDLKRLHEITGLNFEFNNGKLTEVFWELDDREKWRK